MFIIVFYLEIRSGRIDLEGWLSNCQREGGQRAPARGGRGARQTWASSAKKRVAEYCKCHKWLEYVSVREDYVGACKWSGVSVWED